MNYFHGKYQMRCIEVWLTASKDCTAAQLNYSVLSGFWCSSSTVQHISFILNGPYIKPLEKNTSSWSGSTTEVKVLLVVVLKHHTSNRRILLPSPLPPLSNSTQVTHIYLQFTFNRGVVVLFLLPLDVWRMLLRNFPSLETRKKWRHNWLGCRNGDYEQKK